jgi:hypothetical protein
MSESPVGRPFKLSAISRPMVLALFVATCLLSIVSWYTTQQGMVLYLSPWFAVLASLGVQSALVLVAWLIGFTRTQRALLISVYAITAIVSIAFSYGSLYTWFSVRERPATIQRKLYDSLNHLTGQAENLLVAAIGEGEKHILALEEMTEAEKTHGFISRAQDADPYLARIREAVAQEAKTYSATYPEGAGEGLRYTAFDRHAKLARHSVVNMQGSLEGLKDFRANLRPVDRTEDQLRGFRQSYDAIPWQQVKDHLQVEDLALPALPVYEDFVDQSATGQEDLLIAFRELFVAPSNRHVFAFALAAFIDLIIFFLAYASGPYFFGAAQERWVAASAAVDSTDEQIFVRNFLRKLTPSSQGMARADSSGLSPGEQQLCILLVSNGMAAQSREGEKLYYLIDRSMHEHLVEALADQGIHLRASTQRVEV